MTLLKQGLDQAVEWGLLAQNPAAKVKLPRNNRKEPEVLPQEQVEVVMENLAGTYMRMPALIAFHTGMRMGEVLALSWDAVDLEAGTLEVKRSYTLHDEKAPVFKTPKTRAGRRNVKIGTTLIKALKEHHKAQAKGKLAAGEAWCNEHNLVCTMPNGQFIKPTNLINQFRRYMRKLGLKVTFHGLRHTHVSMLIRAGVPINVISERIGHASPSITHNYYVHLLPGMDTEAAEQFERLLVTFS